MYTYQRLKAYLDRTFLLPVKGDRMFNQDEFVVYPGHGVAKVLRVLERKIGGKSTQFYELRFVNKDMTILVPIDKIDAIGIRKLSSQKDIGSMLKMLADPVVTTNHDVVLNWNKRNKEYQNKIRSGKLREIGEIYRMLKHIEQYKELSFGEKNILHQTEALLVEEIVLVCDMGRDKAIQKLRSVGYSVISEKAA